MPKVDNMAMLMMKVVVMYDHDEYLPDVMFINIDMIFMYEKWSFGGGYLGQC